MDRGNALSGDGIAKIVAKDAGMPGGQWLSLCKAAEYVAGVDAGYRYLRFRRRLAHVQSDSGTSSIHG
jgi:hypothetical protein